MTRVLLEHIEDTSVLLCFLECLFSNSVVVKEVVDCDAGADVSVRLCDFGQGVVGECALVRCCVVASFGGDGQAARKRNAGHCFSPEPVCGERVEIGYCRELACGEARGDNWEIGMWDSTAIVDYLEQREAAVLHQHLDARAACVYAVFDELLACVYGLVDNLSSCDGAALDAVLDDLL